MTIKTVNYSKIFAISSFLNERIGIEIEINEGEDAKMALSVAKSLAEEFHKESNPDLYKFNDVPLTADETADIAAMALCETPEKLGREFKNRLTKNTKPYYMDRLKTLTNGFSTHADKK